MNPISEAFKFTYEHSKFNWIMLSIDLAITPIVIMWIIGSWIIQDSITLTETFHYIMAIIFSIGLSYTCAGWLINDTKKHVEQERRREHPCPYCKGKGWR